jgi:hypothetical protein
VRPTSQFCHEDVLRRHTIRARVAGMQMRPRRSAGQRGQASVELVVLLPLVAVLALACWQAVVLGQAVWLSGAAARAAARADAVGGDPLVAARSVLPDSLRRRVAVVDRDRDQPGSVTVRLGIPAVIAGVSLASISAQARFAPQT